MDDRNPPPAHRLTRIVLGITGGIAAYKVAELTRLLEKARHGCEEESA